MGSVRARALYITADRRALERSRLNRGKVVSTCVRWTVLSLIGWQPIKVSLIYWRWYLQTPLSGGDFNNKNVVNFSAGF